VKFVFVAVLALLVAINNPPPADNPFARWESIMPGNAEANVKNLPYPVEVGYIPAYGPGLWQREYFTYTVTPGDGSFATIRVSGYDRTIAGIFFEFIEGQIEVGDLVALYGRPDEQHIGLTRASFYWREEGIRAYGYYDYIGWPRQILRISLKYVGMY
jgi:hypothetical protein